MPSACVATGRRSVPEHFLRCRGIVCSFLYAMWPKCLTDNLTAEDGELRLHGLCWCSLSPSWGGLCILPPSPVHLASFVHPWARLTAFSYSCAGLPPGVCGSDWFMCSSTLSTLTYLSVFISSFWTAAYFWFLVVFCCLFSPEFGVFLPARSDCYKPICLQAFAITQGWLRDLCTLTLEGHWGQRWLKRDDSSPSDLFTQEHLFCFSFSQKHLKKRVVLICVPWYV